MTILGQMFVHKDKQAAGWFMVMEEAKTKIVVSPLFWGSKLTTFDYSREVFERYFRPFDVTNPPPGMTPQTLGRFDLERLRRWSQLR